MGDFMQATDKLIAGYKRFRDGYYEQSRDLLNKLAQEGQSPKIALVSCCDSRVEPSIILDCKPGDLFVIRNVANLVPPCESTDSFHGTSAALEYAVTGLGVESIVVLGHAQCGGIQALMDQLPLTTSESYISMWMKQLASVRDDILGDDSFTSQSQRYHACEQQGISQSLDNLMTFPWIRTRVIEGKLKLHGWYYDLNSIELFSLQSDSGKFQKIS